MIINEINQGLEKELKKYPITICPQCGYERKNSDDKFISADECPKCGVFYNKWKPSAVSKSKSQENEISKIKTIQPSRLETPGARIIFGIIGTPITIGIFYLSCANIIVAIYCIYDGINRDNIESILGGSLYGTVTQLPLVVVIGTWLRMIKKYESMSINMIKLIRCCLICGVALSMVGFVVSLCFAIAILLHFIPAYRGAELGLGFFFISILFLFVAYFFYFLLLKGTPKVHNSITRR
jgi:predicted Zn-ribbon and HTH transcriptional regulator